MARLAPPSRAVKNFHPENKRGFWLIQIFVLFHRVPQLLEEISEYFGPYLLILSKVLQLWRKLCIGKHHQKAPRAEHLYGGAGSPKCLSTTGRAGATETFGVHREGEATAMMLRCCPEPPETQSFPKLPTGVLAWHGAGRGEMGRGPDRGSQEPPVPAKPHFRGPGAHPAPSSRAGGAGHGAGWRGEGSAGRGSRSGKGLAKKCNRIAQNVLLSRSPPAAVAQELLTPVKSIVPRRCPHRGARSKSQPAPRHSRDQALSPAPRCSRGFGGFSFFCLLLSPGPWGTPKPS